MSGVAKGGSKTGAPRRRSASGSGTSAPPMRAISEGNMDYTTGSERKASTSGGWTSSPGSAAILLKSVSLFLQSGRRAARQQQATNTVKEPEPSRVRRCRGRGCGGGGADRAGGSEEPARRMEEGSADGSSGGGRPRLAQSQNQNGKTSAKLMDYFKRKTHFTREEIESLCRVYRKLVATNQAHNAGAAIHGGNPAAAVLQAPSAHIVTEGLDRVVFRELLHNTFDLVTEEVLMDRIFCAFDRCNDGVIRLDEWVCGLSVFIKGEPDERMAFCFRVYDLNSDGFISREEMFHLLRNCLVKQPQDDDPDEGVKDLVELALKKLDYDKDGKVSFKDFQEAITDEPLLLEAFGQCLPSEGACQTFLSTLRS